MKDFKRFLKLFLSHLLEDLQQSELQNKPKDIDVRILNKKLVMYIKTWLTCIVVGSFLMINWKTWHLRADFIIHFPRLLGLLLIEGAIVNLYHYCELKYYKWGMRVAAAAIAVAISVDICPDLLQKSWLFLPILILWAAGILSFLFCMTLLFLQKGVYKIYESWINATIHMIVLCVFLLLCGVEMMISSLFGVIIHPTLNTVQHAIFMFIFFIFGIKLIDAFFITIISKWKRNSFPPYSQ